jgi:AcrR family transcriptional regulator
MTAPMSGRKAQAARNDERILEAARAVFVADPNAPIAAVAQRAEVGISALYRRYASKEELLQRLALDGLRRYIAEVEAALADEGDPWEAFATFMRRSLDAGASSLSRRLAGTFQPTDELNENGRRAYELSQRLLDRTKAAGALREELEVGDLTLIFEALQALQVGEPERARTLRHRYLALVLDALHAPAIAPLPGPAPTWQEISRRWEP